MDLWLNGLISMVDPSRLLNMLMRLVVKKVKFRVKILNRLNRIALRMSRPAIPTPVRWHLIRYPDKLMSANLMTHLLSLNLAPGLRTVRLKCLTWINYLGMRMNLVSLGRYTLKMLMTCTRRRYGLKITLLRRRNTRMNVTNVFLMIPWNLVLKLTS